MIDSLTGYWNKTKNNSGRHLSARQSVIIFN